MKGKIGIILYLLASINLLGQSSLKVLDYRDPFCGEYSRYFGNCSFGSSKYIYVEKSLTSIDSIIITDSSLISYSSSLFRCYAKLNTDSTWINYGGYYGHFKKKDTMSRTLIIPGPGYCYSLSKKIISVGISELTNSSNEVNFSPNPAFDKLYIQNLKEVELKCEIFTIEGKQIQLKQINKEEFDVSGLLEGLYFLRIQSIDGVLTKKIVIQH